MVTAGQKPILDTDILEPFRIRFNPKEVTILDVSISKSSRPVVSCEITQIDSSTFQVAYRIMENNDGCAIDYLYIGKRIPSVEVTGEIIGVRKINLSLKTWQDYYGEISRIENFPDAIRWLKKPCKALGKRLPVENVNSFFEFQQVIAVIHRLEYGVFN